MTWVRSLRRALADGARSLPLARHASARLRRPATSSGSPASSASSTGRADRLPAGVVYEATMRCNLHCEFCYVGDLLNIEGEWRQELPLDALARARSPTRRGSR